MYDYGGGGGWGDPLDRDPQAVLDDVLDEYVSVEGATRDYGVVLTGSLEDLTLAVDARRRPKRLRAERRAAASALTWATGSASTSAARSPTSSASPPTARSCSTRRRRRSTTSRRGVMNGLAPARRALRRRAARSSARELDIVVHGTTTADNTMIEMNGAPHRPARHRGSPRRDRDAPGPQGGDLGPVVPGAARHRPPPGPHPDPRAHVDHHGRRAARRSTRTRSAHGVRRLQALGVHVDRGDVPVLVREPRARAAAPPRSSARSSPTSSTSRSPTR